MPQKLSVMATKINAQAASIATTMTGTTTLEVQDLARLLTALSTRNDLVDPAIGLAYPFLLKSILPG